MRASRVSRRLEERFPNAARREVGGGSEQGTPTPATQCDHGHLPQPSGSERRHVDHVVGAGAGTGGNVVRRFAGKDAWCTAVVASEGLRDTHRLKWVSPIGTNWHHHVLAGPLPRGRHATHVNRPSRTRRAQKAVRRQPPVPSETVSCAGAWSEVAKCPGGSRGDRGRRRSARECDWSATDRFGLVNEPQRVRAGGGKRVRVQAEFEGEAKGVALIARPQQVRNPGGGLGDGCATSPW